MSDKGLFEIWKSKAAILLLAGLIASLSQGQAAEKPSTKYVDRTSRLATSGAEPQPDVPVQSATVVQTVDIQGKGAVKLIFAVSCTNGLKVIDATIVGPQSDPERKLVKAVANLREPSAEEAYFLATPMGPAVPMFSLTTDSFGKVKFGRVVEFSGVVDLLPYWQTSAGKIVFDDRAVVKDLLVTTSLCSPIGVAFNGGKSSSSTAVGLVSKKRNRPESGNAR